MLLSRRFLLLDYRLVLKDGKWRVYNVMIEGISVVKNYGDQFRVWEKVRKG